MSLVVTLGPSPQGGLAAVPLPDVPAVPAVPEGAAVPLRTEVPAVPIEVAFVPGGVPTVCENQIP